MPGHVRGGYTQSDSATYRTGTMRSRWVHIGVTWRIRLNRPSAAAMRPFVKLLWSLVSLLQQLHTVRYFVGCSVNIFSSANNNAHIIRRDIIHKTLFDCNYFQSMNFAWQFEYCVAVCSRSSWAWRFLEHVCHKVWFKMSWYTFNKSYDCKLTEL